jgi:peptidyl-prolyl isomerase H (cyclophilin H)
MSIYGGESFEVENYNLKHDKAGLVSLTSISENKVGSQFMITCRDCDWLDDKNVVCGRVVDSQSMLTVRKIENVSVGSSSKPQLPVIITQCGEF